MGNKARGRLRAPWLVALVLLACRGVAPVAGEAEVQVGVVSYYADSLAGRLTASGVPYDPGAATCAHRRLPFGTMVEVEVIDTGRKARCRVNDRGPFVKGRILDVSRSVAERLGLLRRGVARARVTVIRRP